MYRDYVTAHLFETPEEDAIVSVCCQKALYSSFKRNYNDNGNKLKNLKVKYTSLYELM